MNYDIASKEKIHEVASLRFKYYMKEYETIKNEKNMEEKKEEPQNDEL